MKTTLQLDLTKQAPRSPRVRLGGYALLPRIIDKCRADLHGTIGEYHTDCPMDRQFLTYVDIPYDDLREAIRTHHSDNEILQWINTHTQKKKDPSEIEAWSDYQNRRAPAPLTPEHQYFLDTLASLNKERGDIQSWGDLIDLDDFCSFGGVA